MSRPCDAPYAIPLITIKKMVREQAGDVKVPDDTLLFLCGLIQSLVKEVMSQAARELQGVAILDGKDVKKSMKNGNRDVAALLVGVRARKSSSPKRKSSKRKSSKRKSSSKRCGRGKSLIKGFVRDGKRVKSYCRKSSAKK
jgi:hypothetical protein